MIDVMNMVWGAIGVFVGIGINLLMLAVGYGRLSQKVDGINKRLDRINGHIDKHEEKLANQGERIARIEGKEVA